MNALRPGTLARSWGRMTVHEWDGAEPAILFLHGNRCAARNWYLLRQLTIPVAQIYGTAGWREDTPTRLAIPEKPNIRLYRIEGAGHFLPHKRPVEVARICEEVRRMTPRRISS